MKFVIAGSVFFFFMSRTLRAHHKRQAAAHTAQQARIYKSSTGLLDTRNAVSLERSIKRVAAFLPTSLLPKQVSSQSKKIEQLILSAGRPLNLDAEHIIALKVLLSTTMVTLLALLAIISGLNFSFIVGLGLAFGGVGFFAPDFWLKSKARQRAGQICSALPTTIDLLAISVAAGMGFDMALKRVVEKLHGPLSEELSQVQLEMETGVSRREALGNMLDRVELQDIRLFVTSINQALQQGTSIQSVLELQSSEIRTRKRLAVQEASATAPLKMLFPLVFFIMPALLLVAVVPSLMRFF